MDLDLEWDRPLHHRKGAEERLCGIDVFYEFRWRDVFRDERTQFRNGKSLATFVKDRCPPGKTPALLLTLRDNVQQGLRHTERFAVFVVNLTEYRSAESDAAVSYLANHLDVDITDIEQLQKLADAADPKLVRSFIESSLDIGHIADWALDNPTRLEELRELLEESPDACQSLTQALKSVAAEHNLDETDIAALAAFLKSLPRDDLQELTQRPDVISQLYASAPDGFRDAIAADASAEDVVAIAHRKLVVEEFRSLLEDAAAFEEALEKANGRREAVWQRFLEANPWILGVGLAGQLLTAWDNDRLEQVVAGYSVAQPGKRTDALLRTSGRIRALVFAEIKHHETKLLDTTEYRAGCWAPSTDLAGGVTQIQQTVDLAVSSIQRRLPEVDEGGAETGEATWLVRPRSFLILGRLDELRGTSGVHAAKYQSFELYRRNLYEPEILTFDELLARAEWHVELAQRS